MEVMFFVVARCIVDWSHHLLEEITLTIVE